MLDVVNGLANGWLVTPMIDAFARRRLFKGAWTAIDANRDAG